MNRHLTNDELLDRLYALGEAEGETHLHLQKCPGCADRMRAFERRRAEMAAGPEISNEFLASQRRGIYARLDERSGGMHVRWAPAVAAGFLLAAGVYLSVPGRHAVSQSPYRPAIARAEISDEQVFDEQLFSDVYSMEQSAEPRAAVALHALFAAADGDEEQ